MATRQHFALHYDSLTPDGGYLPIDGRGTPQASFAAAAHRWKAPAVARHLLVKLHDAPGTGRTRTVNVLIDEVVALTVTLSDDETEASVTGSDSIAVDAKVCIQHSSTGTPATTRGRITFVCDYTTDGVACYGGGGSLSAGGPHNTGLFSSAGAWSTTGQIFSRTIAPAPGTVDRLAMDLTAAVPAGETLDIWISVNGVQVGATHTLTEGETTLDEVVDIPFVAEDLLLLHATTSWVPSATFAMFGIRVTADDGVSFMCSHGTVQLPPTPRYAGPMQGGASGSLSTESDATVQGAYSSFVLRDLYAWSSPQNLSIDGIVVTMRINGVDTDLTLTTPRIVVAQPAVITSNLDDEITVDPTDALSLQFIPGDDWFQGLLSWAMVSYALASDAAIGDSVGGVIGPLLWVEHPRKAPAGAVSTDVWSDLDMHCPQSYYGGYKEGRLLHAGDAERALSDWFTGEWVGSTYRYAIADPDSRVRSHLASLTDRYWTRPIAVRMTSRENRAVLGRPYTVMVGPLIDAQPTFPLGWDMTIGDAVSRGILSDDLMMPWRLIRDGFLDQLVAVSERLDLEQPEPIIYGTHSRVTNEAGSPTSDDAAGFRITPIYLGIENIDGDDAHVWLVAGHACKSVNIYVDGVAQAEVGSWLIPGHTNWNAQFGAKYVDKLSSTYGVNRRYTLIYGYLNGTLTDWFKQRTSVPSRCAVGDLVLTVEVEGIEETGDGTGTLITDRFQQYEHFLINFVANQGSDSYQSGAWLANPEWSAFDLTVPIVEESSFTDASAIGAERITGGSPAAGYIGAAVIGRQAGDRSSVRRWLAEWNRSCGCRFGITHLGEMRIVLLHPTAAAKAAAPLFTDNYEILQGSFVTDVKWGDHATSIPYRTDYNPITGDWETSGTVEDAQAIVRWEREILADRREYPFAPGRDQAEHLAILELRIRANPPRIIRFDNAITADGVDDNEAAYADLGDYIRYVHYDQVSEEREIRMAQVIRHQIRGSARRVVIEAVDCEDFVNYDTDGSPSGGWGGSP